MSFETIFIESMDEGSARTLTGRIQRLLRELGKEYLIEKGAFLDIGTGDGSFLVPLSRLYPNARICGLTKPRCEEEAKRKNPNAEIRVGYFQDMPFPDYSVAVAMSNNIFDYAKESTHMIGRKRCKNVTYSISELVRELKRVLVPEGIYVPGEYRLKNTLSEDGWKLFYTNFQVVPSSDPEDMIFQKPPYDNAVQLHRPFLQENAAA